MTILSGTMTCSLVSLTLDLLTSFFLIFSQDATFQVRGLEAAWTMIKGSVPTEIDKLLNIGIVAKCLEFIRSPQLTSCSFETYCARPEKRPHRREVNIGE